MKRMLLSLGLIGAVFATSYAYAAEVRGVVKSLSTKERTITLVSGKAYSFPGKMDVSKVKPGLTVIVTYSPSDPSSFWATALGITGAATKIDVVSDQNAAS